jgi:hypothetical protein
LLHRRYSSGLASGGGAKAIAKSNSEEVGIGCNYSPIIFSIATKLSAILRELIG